MDLSHVFTHVFSATERTNNGQHVVILEELEVLDLLYLDVPAQLQRRTLNYLGIHGRNTDKL